MGGLISVSVDMRELNRKLNGISKAMRDKVLMKSLNDAATQTRNKAQREIGKSINLPAAKIKEKLPIRKAYMRGASNSRLWSEVRGQYQQVGIQNFIGWTYTGRVRGRNLSMTKKVTRFGGSKSNKGLRVRIHKNRPPMVFSIAFPLRGGSFFQRVKPSAFKSPKAWGLNMPITRIVGTSIWQEFQDYVDAHKREFAETYKRRAEYWVGEAIRKQYGQ